MFASQRFELPIWGNYIKTGTINIRIIKSVIESIIRPDNSNRSNNRTLPAGDQEWTNSTH